MTDDELNAVLGKCPHCKAKLGDHHEKNCQHWGQVLPSECPGVIDRALVEVLTRQLATEREAHARTLAALRAVVGHFVGVDHHRDDCPGLLDHDGLTVLGPVCRDHQVAEQAEAAIAAAKVTPPRCSSCGGTPDVCRTRRCHGIDNGKVTP